ncbi:MAG TPA: choice-of-anchor V domain-containing protein [Bryobacteraceae bacterium]|nr:choice-of-anchor V domain-containing protein [Bryobacteraceae bacterium]
MKFRSKLIGLGAGIVFVGAALIYAHSAGPDPRHTGAPGDTTCADSTCHDGAGVGAVNVGGGSVVVNFANGQTYTPGGGPQTFTVVITDPAEHIFGFQMTARPESNLANGQAGDFMPSGQQIVICDDTTLKGPNGCSASDPVQFIEHDMPYTSGTIQVEWTPPSSNIGNVHIYVAANAAFASNGTTPNPRDHIYTAEYVLTPQAADCVDATPSISLVQSAGGFNPKAGLASGTWLEIYGTNLTCTQPRGWAGSDFKGNNAPTSLNNVSVTVDGIPAYVDYISPGQVNVQAPDDPNTGAGIAVVLANSSGTSNTFSMQKNAIAPALLSPSPFNTQGHQWVVAQHADQTYVGKTGLISGLSFSPAKPGETIVIYGIGFGPVSPAIAAGTIAKVSNHLATTPTFRFGQTAAKLQYYGLAPNFVGLYQFNATVPNVSAGDMPLNVDVGGVPLNQTLYITVGH